ncbi:multicopper oxidase [Polychaeton citri CBS 116435]|uniref:Multicopper oxidase n=1 Tax=Polychaeton citri CBS 116435 TaxID=1314669 RepID=A0A9P4QAD0_9PEZI|nr:multicopper oxidase [Polychaeton citri CBS 116435]
MSSFLLLGAALCSISSAFPTVQSDSGATGNLAFTDSPAPNHRGGVAWEKYGSPAWVPHGQSLTPHLHQSQTNGESWLGTAHAPKLPPWKKGSPMPGGRPWGHRSAGHTNPYKDPPETGITRHYDFNVSYATISPDGVEKNALVINGAFPGPTIEANWGDWIEVVVHNNIPDEGTSMHWHGLLQQNTGYMDGVPSITQCPIAPGTTFTYRFKADLYGTSWYHSHYSAQYAGGAAGPMVIYGPHDNYEYDEDLGPVMISDWYHEDYFTLVEQVMAPADLGLLPPLSNNNLINGKMNYPCPQTNRTCTANAGISKFYFETGKKYRLRLINAGAEGIQKFSIDGYSLTVIANDFVPVVPYQTDVVTLSVGQRTDVVVEATGNPTDAVWMRSSLGKTAFSGGCTLHDGVSPEAVAAIYYQKANTSAIPKTTSLVASASMDYCGNDNLTTTVPYYPIRPQHRPGITHHINITYQSNGTNNLFYMNNSTFRGDYNDPILLEAKIGKREFDPVYNVLECEKGESTRVVLYNYAQTGAHPMHMHGHNIFVLAEGYGEWDGTVTNKHNPQRRDTQLLWNAKDENTPAYVVLQFTNDNPGAWPLHCHIAWHVSAGLYVTLLEEPALITSGLTLPSTSAQLCRDWGSWTGTNIPNEIDSGL